MKLHATFCALVLAALPARAAELTLAAALEQAAANNPDARAARARAEAAAAESAAAGRTANWPRLGLSSAWTASDQAAAVFAQTLDAGRIQAADFALDRLNDPDVTAHLSTSLGLEWPIDVFGKTQPLRRGAAAQARAADETALAVDASVRLNVVEAWEAARVAARAVSATESALAGAESRERQLEAQAEEGAALRSDVLRARARRRALEADLAGRRGDARSAAAALGRAVGGSEPVTAAPCEEGSTADGCAPPDDPGELGRWLSGLEGRPALRAATAQRDRAAETATGADRDGRPDLLLVARLQDDRRQPSGGRTSGTAGLFLRWTVYDPQRAARREAARTASEAAEAELASARDRARYEIEAAWNRAKASRERWLAAHGGTEEGHEALRVVRQRRAAGLATLTDELETEAAALAAQLGELEAAAEASVARAALEAAAGSSSPEREP